MGGFFNKVVQVFFLSYIKAHTRIVPTINDNKN